MKSKKRRKMKMFPIQLQNWHKTSKKQKAKKQYRMTKLQQVNKTKTQKTKRMIVNKNQMKNLSRCPRS